MGCVWGISSQKDGETSGQFFGGEDLEVSWGWGRSWKVGISSGLQGEMMKPKGKIQSRLMNSCWYSWIQSRVSSAPSSRLFAEPALSRIPQAASSLPAVLGPGHSPASRRTPRSPLLRLSCSLPATRRVRLPARQAAPHGSHTHPGLRRGEGVGEPPTRGKLPLGRWLGFSGFPQPSRAGPHGAR